MPTLKLRTKGRLFRFLHGVVLVDTTDRERAERSRLSWRPGDEPGHYVLTPLGVLNGLFGLVVEIKK